MNIPQLETFCAVADKKSFIKAAEVVHRTQPTVSAQIQALERYYGVPLFNRTGKEVTLTDGGKIVLEYAEKILKLREASKEAVDELRNLARGGVVVGASTITGVYILPQILSDFNQEYPEVKVSIRITDSKGVINRVSEGELEMGIVGEKVNDKRLEFTPLAEDRIVLITRANHPWAKKPKVSLDSRMNRGSSGRRAQGQGARCRRRWKRGGSNVGTCQWPSNWEAPRR